MGIVGEWLFPLHMQEVADMADARILVADDEEHAQIRLIGRATFSCSQRVRDYGMRVLDKNIKHVHIDLSECEGMDSTIMGVLAMIGLRARKQGLNAEIVNADERLKKLLYGLGLKKLFVFTHTLLDEVNWATLCHTERDDQPLTAERTILEAHETLMQIDPENMPKFRDVVDYLRQDIERLETEN